MSGEARSRRTIGISIYTVPGPAQPRAWRGRSWVACLAAVTSVIVGAGIGLAQRQGTLSTLATDVRPDRDNLRQIGSPMERLHYIYSYGFSTGDGAGRGGVQMYDQKIDHAGPGGFRQEEVWNNLPGFVTGSTYFEEMSLAFCTDDTTRRQTWFCLRTAHDLLGVGAQRGIAILSQGGFRPTHTFAPDGSFNVAIRDDGSANASIRADGSARFAGAITVASCTGCENRLHLAIAALWWTPFGLVMWLRRRDELRARLSGARRWTEPAVWANAVLALLGAWFFLAPFAPAFAGGAAESSTGIAGAILLVFAGWAALKEKPRRFAWIQYVNALVGVWLIVVPFALPFTVKPARLASFTGGIIALLLNGLLIVRTRSKAASSP